MSDELKRVVYYSNGDLGARTNLEKPNSKEILSVPTSMSNFVELHNEIPLSSE